MFKSIKVALLGSVFAAATTGAALAADPIMPVPVVPVVPVATSDFDWSGFYAGIGVTGSMHDWEAEGTAPVFDATIDPRLFSGEVVLGANAQFGSVVFGLEGTVGVYTTNIEGEATGDFSDLPDEIQELLENVDGDFTGSSTGLTAGLSARLGYLVTPSFLLYGSAGVTGFYSDNNTTVTYIDLAGDEVTEDVEAFGNVFGTIGVGAEFAVADNITLDLEYKYYGFSVLDALDEPGVTASSAGHGVSAQILFHF